MKGHTTMQLRRFLLVASLLSAFSPHLLAQVSGAITSSQCVQISIDNQATVGIQVTGTWSGTLQPEISIQGQAAQNIQVTPTNSSTAQSTITANGLFQARVAGGTTFLLCGNTVASGTANVFLNATQAVSLNGIGAGFATSVPFDGITQGAAINTQTAPPYVNSPLDPSGGTWGGAVFNWYLNDTSTSGDTAAFGSLESVNCLTAWTSSPSRGFGCQLINLTTPAGYANNLNVAYEGQRMLLIPQGTMSSNQLVAGANWQVDWQSTGTLSNNMYGHTIQTAVTAAGTVQTVMVFDAISGSSLAGSTITNDIDFKADFRTGGTLPNHWGFHCGNNSSNVLQTNTVTASFGVGGNWCIYDQTSVLGTGRNHLDSVWVPGVIRTSVAGCSVAGCGSENGSGSNSDLAGVLSFAATTTASYTFQAKDGTNTSAPVCTISPISPGTTTFSITTLSTSTLTVTASASFTGSVNYVCIFRN